MRRSRAVVGFTRRGHLAEIALDLRRDGGRFTADSAVRFSEACARCDEDPIWVVWLRSAGRDFCLGTDGGRKQWPRLPGTDFVAALAAVRQPIVASVRGRAEAEGFELALAADLRVVERGSRFAMTQVAHGRLPGFGGTQRLPRAIGMERALRVLLLGESIPGRRAADWGLAARLASRADEGARRLADDLLERGPIALRFAKEAVRRSLDFALDDGARFEHDLYVLLETTRDRAEGVRAFLAKRNPTFHGE
jgi:enoyl-CoA hydratase/carnithine racemase